VDLAVDPNHSGTVFAAVWQAAQKNGATFDHGPGSGIYRSTDAGAKWRKLTSGLPVGMLGRIGLVVSPSRPGRVYAIADDREFTPWKNAYDRRIPPGGGIER